MKRGLLDEYERVRREAGLGRSQPEFPEEPSKSGEMASERVPPAEAAQVAANLRQLADELAQRLDGEDASAHEKIRVKAREARDRAQRIVEEARRRNEDADRASHDAQATG
jgi:hypothetical protein